MKKEAILYGIIGLLVGVLITGFSASYAVNTNNRGMMEMMGMSQDVIERMHPFHHAEMSMSEMSEQLKNKTGDDFDKAFIEMMIEHHQGAIDMARLAPERAKHDEIKKLSQDIISAQNREIADMQLWQQNWGYAQNDMQHLMHP